MPIEILMPALSPTMEEGKLAKWLVREGQTVKAGDIIAEIETDKATMEVEAVEEGRISKLLIAEGTEGVKVNAPIALVLAEGESEGALQTPKAPAPKASVVPPAATAQNVQVSPSSMSAGSGRAAGPPRIGGGFGSGVGTGVGARGGAGAGNGRGRIFASPLARRLAKNAGVDLAALSGSGPHGRIVKSDIEAALQRGGNMARPKAGTAVAAPVQSTSGVGVPALSDDKILALYERGSYEIVPHDGMRRVIAQRLTLSKQTIPHFYLTVECRLDELLRSRERMNAASPKIGPRAYKLSVNDFIIKAMALALMQVPSANVTWTEGGTLRHKYCDVGVAVAIEGGLFTPVIRHAELKSLSEISNEMKDLAERARKRRLAPHEYQGGTTSISNLGMYGIKSFDAVINPPHATILAVGAGEKRPIASGDKVEIATIGSCTLSCDHRVVDGAVGAELLNAFKMMIEEPVRMLV
jgi:pyruvate dehydrogenase E2 component (dihydrolipoamide acetyltransferase)